MREKTGTLILSISFLWIPRAGLEASENPVAHWKLDETEGTTASDSSGNGNHGKLRGDPHWSKGRIGGALEFDGDDDVIIDSVPPTLKPKAVTVTAWVKVDPSTKGWAWVAAQGDNYGLVVNRNNDDSVFFYIYEGGEWPRAGTWKGAGSGDVGIRDGRWHHVAGAFDPRYRTISVYKDGVKVGVGSAAGPIAYEKGEGFTIGSMMGERFFKGSLDDVRVYDRILSSEELDRLALRPPPASRENASLSRRRGKPVPVGVVFHKDTIFRLGGHGDNWRPAWVADGSQITPMCDGDWLNSGHGYHTHLYRILGGPDGFKREDLPNYPDFSGEAGSWFGYALLSVDGVLYSFVSKTPGPRWSGPFRGMKLLKSKDNGRTWYRVDRRGRERRIGPHDEARNEVTPGEMFFLEEFGLPHQKKEAYPFSFVDFVKCGKDNAAARDGYIYIYSPEGAHAHKLLLARVPKEKLGERSAWEYFVKFENGRPVWTADLRKRGYVHVFPEKSGRGDCFGWYSWLPSVVWNEGLGLYIMVNGGTYGGPKMTSSDADYYHSWMHTRTGSLGFWWSENPYGPWRRFYYTEYWTVDDPKNRTYQPSLSPKWISKDGKEMILIWSDAMADEKGRSHTVNYLWNHMKITIVTK